MIAHFPQSISRSLKISINDQEHWMIETTLAVAQTYTVKLNNHIIHALGVSSILHISTSSENKMTLSNN